MDCGACNGALIERFTVREMMYGTGETFDYQQCASCSSLWLVDPPEDASPYYADDYYSLSRDEQRPDKWDYYRWLKSRTYFAARRLRVPWPQRLSRPAFTSYGDIAGLIPKARVLDVGCGSGELLVELRRCGFRNLVGVDPFIPGSSDDGRLRLVKGDLDAVSGEFDVVMMHHSLEHVPNPGKTLEQARGLLAPNGRMVVRIPLVAEAWDLYGVDWVQLDAPRHTALFSVEGFARLAHRAGLRVVHQYCDSSAFQFWGSEQYRLGVSLSDSRSVARGGESPLFTHEQIETWTSAAQSLNRDMRGDQGTFVLAVDN